MTNLSLSKISDQINESVYNFYTEKTQPEWLTMDSILEQACSDLPSKDLRYLIPKVILVDIYYKANLIRYLDKPNNDEPDYRFGYYKLIAQGLQKLGLDAQIEAIRRKAPRLCASNLGDVVECCNDVSAAVKESKEKFGIVFASKLLHFSAPDLFPIIDDNAEKKLKDVLIQLDDDANKRIDELRANVDKELLLDLWYEKYPDIYKEHWEEDITGSKLLGILEEKYPDLYIENYRQLLDQKLPDRYTRFATDILCLQQAICLDGGPMYSFRELDKYLYGSRWQEEAD